MGGALEGARAGASAFPTARPYAAVGGLGAAALGLGGRDGRSLSGRKVHARRQRNAERSSAAGALQRAAAEGAAANDIAPKQQRRRRAHGAAPRAAATVSAIAPLAAAEDAFQAESGRSGEQRHRELRLHSETAPAAGRAVLELQREALAREPEAA